MNLEGAVQYLASRKESVSNEHSRESVTAVIKGRCIYYHYLCDGVDDRGWGCGYRTLQTICSFCHHHRDHACSRDCTEKFPDFGRVKSSENRQPVESDGHLDLQSPSQKAVPNITKIQEILVKVKDKTTSFIGSKNWIGTFEASIVVDELFGIPCRILHAPNGFESVISLLHQLVDHFHIHGSPVMIGGDKDGASKTLIGVSYCQESPEHSQFLIADPHYIGKEDDFTQLVQHGHIQWKTLTIACDKESFYNFCLPVITQCTQ